MHNKRGSVYQLLKQVLVGMLIFVLPLVHIPQVLACGWFGDGEDSGPEALAVGADGKRIEVAPETPVTMFREANRLLKFGLSGYSGAFRLFLKAAKQGYAPAQNNLANMLEQGLGVVPDSKESAHWYLQAARAGEARAQHSIGNDYIKGIGVEKKPTTGFQWIMCSARQGHLSAVSQLAELYHKGLGTAVNHTKAGAWEKVAKQLATRPKNPAPVIEAQIGENPGCPLVTKKTS
ncbi:MAG TPA: sel1 repeat family protein [Gammaproteobacteria bacterium]|nr:sel1 repeat family protein [Gammaproteobacteria bacterium]